MLSSGDLSSDAHGDDPPLALRVPARACVQAPHFPGFAAGWRKNADMTSEQDPRARQHLPERELDPSQEQARSQTLMQRAGMDREHIVDRITDVNDGIISTAGIVEGFSGAGLGGTTIVVAAASALIAGSIAIASGKYAEVAAEHELRAAMLDEVTRVQQLTRQEEVEELTEIYQDKGLSSGLATQVAEELTGAGDQSRLTPAQQAIPEEMVRPMVAALGSGGAFVFGSALPLGIVWILPFTLEGLITYVAVLLALTVSAVVLTKIGRSSLWHNVRRSLMVGLLTMSTAWIAGHVFT